MTCSIVAEVGKFYCVPCMFVGSAVRTSWVPLDGWVPVIGPRHDDVQHLNFHYEHYHVDWRFIPETQYEHATLIAGAPHGRVLTTTSADGLSNVQTLKRRLCRRLMPEHPAIGRVRFGSKSIQERDASNWQRMEASFSDCRLKPGNICPHRGIDLTPFIKGDGTAVCPAHGLRWDTKTGALLPHHARTE